MASGGSTWLIIAEAFCLLLQDKEQKEEKQADQNGSKDVDMPEQKEEAKNGEQDKAAAIRLTDLNHRSYLQLGYSL